MSDTPRTDALLLEINEGRKYADVGSVTTLCRQMERDLTAAIALASAQERERCAKCRDEVPVLPGDMPEEMFEALQGDKDATSEAFRIVIRQTLDEYESAIHALPPTTPDDVLQVLKDAERYRWLQDQRSKVWHEIAETPMNHTDAAIDAAMEGK